jgi:hypothetical protein
VIDIASCNSLLSFDILIDVEAICGEGGPHEIPLREKSIDFLLDLLIARSHTQLLVPTLLVLDERVSLAGGQSCGALETLQTSLEHLALLPVKLEEVGQRLNEVHGARQDVLIVSHKYLVARDTASNTRAIRVGVRTGYGAQCGHHLRSERRLDVDHGVFSDMHRLVQTGHEISPHGRQHRVLRICTHR